MVKFPKSKSGKTAQSDSYWNKRQIWTHTEFSEITKMFESKSINYLPDDLHESLSDKNNNY